MKNIRIVFILLSMCMATVFVNAQTATTLQVDAKEICTQKTVTASAKTVTPQMPSKKSLVVTKQRRLKSYQSNHKIARKRKTAIANKSIAAID